MLAAKLTDKGQLVIPKSIRDALRLGPGSELLVSLEAGRVLPEIAVSPKDGPTTQELDQRIRVLARNNNGDGLSWQVCHDVLVEDCESRDHAGPPLSRHGKLPRISKRTSSLVAAS